MAFTKPRNSEQLDFAVIVNSLITPSLKMAHIIQSFNRHYIETRIARHGKLISRLESFPFRLPFEPDLTEPRVDFHQFRCARLERQDTRKNDPKRTSCTVREHHCMTDALPIEVHVSLLFDTHIIELRHASVL